MAKSTDVSLARKPDHMILDWLLLTGTVLTMVVAAYLSIGETLRGGLTTHERVPAADTETH